MREVVRDGFKLAGLISLPAFPNLFSPDSVDFQVWLITLPSSSFGFNPCFIGTSFQAPAVYLSTIQLTGDPQRCRFFLAGILIPERMRQSSKQQALPLFSRPYFLQVDSLVRPPSCTTHPSTLSLHTTFLLESIKKLPHHYRP